MCDTMALPISTPRWPRRIRRLFTTAVLVAGAALLSWGIVEMSAEGGVVTHLGGYDVNATIDEQMMLNVTISTVDAVAPPLVHASDVFQADVVGEEDDVYYDDEGEDDEMVDDPNDYEVASQRRREPKS